MTVVNEYRKLEAEKVAEIRPLRIQINNIEDNFQKLERQLQEECPHPEFKERIAFMHNIVRETGKRPLSLWCKRCEKLVALDGQITKEMRKRIVECEGFYYYDNEAPSGKAGIYPIPLRDMIIKETKDE